MKKKELRKSEFKLDEIDIDLDTIIGATDSVYYPGNPRWRFILRNPIKLRNPFHFYHGRWKGDYHDGWFNEY